MKKALAGLVLLLVVFVGFRVMRGSLQNSPGSGSDLIASSSRSYDGQVIENFTLEGFDENGDQLWELSGEVAHVGKNLDIFIEKNVKLKMQGSTTIESDRVYWMNDQSKFITKEPVRILNGLQRIEGWGAHGNLNEGFLQINQNIRMFLDGPVFVTCWGPLKIFRNEKRLVLYRDATIHDSQGTVKSERLDVLYDDDSGKIRELVARGNVVIRRGENVSYSDMAIYNTQTHSVRLLGEPKVVLSEQDLDDFNDHERQ